MMKVYVGDLAAALNK